VRPEVHHVLDAVINCQRSECLRPFRVGAAGTPDHDQLQSITNCRITLHQLGNGFDQHVRCFERLDTAHEQDHLSVLSYPELGP
jgi:hypothetical protein